MQVSLSTCLILDESVRHLKRYISERYAAISDRSKRCQRAIVRRLGFSVFDVSMASENGTLLPHQIVSESLAPIQHKTNPSIENLLSLFPFSGRRSNPTRRLASWRWFFRLCFLDPV